MAKISMDAVYAPSENIVAREIEGEIIIVPLARGIGDAEDDLFSLNETGRAVWKLLDGRRSLAQIVQILGADYTASTATIGKDVAGLMAELLKRRMVVEKHGA